MKKLILISLLMLSSNHILAQIADCNQKVWVKHLTKQIPKQICIPKGYHITEVYPETDLNNDGLNDFIFDWNKETLNDGDTIFVSFYLRVSDSTYSFFRTLKNLYPIYFKSY